MISHSDTIDDVSALGWVQEELRKSLDAAHKALRRALRETESTFGSDLDDVDPALLRAARAQLHQGVGVLELVGLPAGATLLRASEAVVQRYMAKPHKLESAAVDAIERASFALLDFLGRRLAGKAVSSVAMFPQYRAVQEAAGAERVHPADLWPQDWQWHAVQIESGVASRPADATTGAEFEAQALALMRSPSAQVTRSLSDLAAALAVGASHVPEQAHIATVWQLAAAFFEAQSAELLKPDVYTKRLTSRLLAQLRQQQRGDPTAGERLAKDLAFFCAQAAAPAVGQAPRLTAVRQAYPPSREALPADYNEAVLGRHDPAAVAQARKRVGAAKDSWSAVAGGESHRFAGLNEQFSLVADSLRRLVPGGDALGDALSRAVAQTVNRGSAPAPGLAMEIATSVLYLEAALEDGAFGQPEQGPRIARLAQRIEAVRAGGDSEPLEPWMEELYRHVSDRQTLGSVVQELRMALSESEKLIDHFFRAPTDAAVLMPVPGQLQAMRGVLSVLGLDQATHAVLRMRDDVDALVAAGGGAQQQPLFERLAGNLSALSFLIDLVGVQPQAAKTMFRFDTDSGLLVSQLLRHDLPPEAGVPAQQAPRVEPELIAEVQELAAAASASMPLAEVSEQIERISLSPAVASQPELAASLSTAQAALEQAASPGAGLAPESSVRGQIAEALAGFVSTASDASTLDGGVSPPASARMPLISLTPTPPVHATGLEGDDEMREIFIEEAREVLAGGREALAALRGEPDDSMQLTTLRRAFHTLKGSSRMVGLGDYGEAAWACEQLYNAWLASQRPASEELLACSDAALNHLSGWTEAIATHTADTWRNEPLRRAADALRLEGLWIGLEPHARSSAPMPMAPAEPMAAVPVPLAVVLPPASDLDLPSLPALDLPGSGAADAQAAAVEPVAELPTLPSDEDEPSAANAPGATTEEPASGAPALNFTFDLGETIEPPPLTTEPPPGAASLDELLQATDLDLPAAPTGLPAATPEAQLPALQDEIKPRWDVAPTAPMTLDELPNAASLQEETVITTLDLAMPGIAPAEALEDSTAQPQATDAPLPGAIQTPDESAASDAAVPAPDSASADAGADQFRQVGPLRIGIPLFNIYLNEADELSRRLGTELAEWALELHRPVGETAVALAHSLAGSSATVGFADLSALARQLEHVLMRSQTLGSGNDEDSRLFNACADELRRLLHQFAAGFLKAPSEALMQQLAAHEQALVQRVHARRPSGSDEEAEEGRTATPSRLARLDAVPRAPASTVTGIVPAFATAPAPAVAPRPDEGYTELGAAEFKPFAPRADEAEPRAPMQALDGDEDIDAVDAVDADLFAFFEDEAQDLLPQLSAHLRDWMGQPSQPSHASAAMRTLHTLKGGARLAGAMRMGERAHRLETAIEHLLARDDVAATEIEALLGRADTLVANLEALRQRDALDYEAAQAAAMRALAREPVPPGPAHDEPARSATVLLHPVVADLPAMEPPTQPPAVDEPAAAEVPLPMAVPSAGAQIDWSRFATAAAATAVPQAATDRAPAMSATAVRVRTRLLDRMVNQAGEVSITRARLESEVGQIRSSLRDLTDNLERLRGQLRDIELQAETQMSTRMEAAKAAAESFDPLEFDRFTRFQELTRMMAESVNDVATVQRSLQRTLETTEDELAAQARLTRELQDDLLRTRMVEFEGLSERLYRVVRQAAKETGKQVRLDIVGGSIEIDRGVLDRMTGAFEHLLRNGITHGIEAPAERSAAGKDATGTIVVSLHQEGNEVSVEFRDDGAGLNLPRIRDKAVAMGLVDGHAAHADAELAKLIFTPGFSTAETVSELAGRGVGMDVVRSEVNALGGRIETATAAGQGTSFRLVLPLTTAVTQVVMLRCGAAVVAVPSTLVEIVRRASTAEIEAAYASGRYRHGEHDLPFFWLGALLQDQAGSTEAPGRTQPVVVVRSAQQRVVLHVDEVLGNQEVVVKNLGPQLSRLPGLAGMTLLASGTVALIYNPVALATVYGDAARRAIAAMRAAVVETALQPALPAGLRPAERAAAPSAPLVLVVDDSLTVRRVTQRLLVREGYRVALAKDGLDALEQLAGERPAVVLSDIEMPRMDGFDLVRNIRADGQLAALPVIMITSRIAHKHREYAAELGVNHYLGKPYSEEELLGLIARYCAERAAEPT